jgi:tetratricopeptide (TPR) repeat protein
MVKIMQQELRNDNLDFEIEFYSSIIEEAPDYVDALMLLGEAYTRKGLYQKGLEVEKRLIELRPADPIIHYNAACNHSLLRQKKSALKCLRRAIALGYRDIEHMATDPDLAFLRDDTAFQLMLRHLCKRLLTQLRQRYPH